MYILSKLTITDYCEMRERSNLPLFSLINFSEDGRYNATYFSDSEDKCGVFRIYTTQSGSSYNNPCENDKEIIKKVKELFRSVIMYYGNKYRSEYNKYPIEILLKTDDWSEVETLLDSLNISYPQPYVYDESIKCNFSIKNNTEFDDVLILDMIERFGFERIQTAKINRDSYNSIIYNDANRNYPASVSYYADKSFDEWLEKYFIKESSGHNIHIPAYNEASKIEFFYVAATETSINFTKMQLQSKIDEEGNVLISAKSSYKYHYDIKGGSSCIRLMARGNRESSPMEMFNINSKNICRPDGIFVFDGEKDVYRFFLSNKEFFDKCGFTSFVSNMHMSMNLHAAMVLYLTIIYEYPQIELLVKMGHECLVEDFFKDLICSGRKDSIIQKIKELDQLIDKTTSKGSMVLRFPSYIGDYLRTNKCGLNEYLFWRDVYELENISKENFEKFISLPERVILNMGFDDRCCRGWYHVGFQEIIKYPGYSLIKTIKYIVSESLKTINGDVHGFQPFNNMLNTLKDTLSMAEDLDIEIEPYPSELIKIHNEIMTLYKDKEESGLNQKAEDIANVCEKELESVFNSNASNLPTDAMKELTYIFPKSQSDFTKEGISQHNCVGGYFNRVVHGECIIFFVRKKDDIGSSYITAECRTNGIGQVMYSNNRPVPSDSNDYKYCQFICNKLRNAKQQGRIECLNDEKRLLGRR